MLLSIIAPRRRCLFSLFVACFILNAYVKSQYSCFTPNSAYGRCVPYKQCSYITNLLLSYGDNITEDVKNYIRKSRCNANVDEIFICCEPRYIEMQTTSTTSTTTETVISTTEAPTTKISERINEGGFNILNDIKCGHQLINKVAFGEETSLAEFPWMALLQYDSRDLYNCGGSLITERYVLTAAHCIVGTLYKVTGVRLGEHNLDMQNDCQRRGKMLHCNPPVEDFGIEASIPHPGYQSTGIIHDVALLRLNRKVEFKEHIKPICLPITEKSQQLQQDQMYYISGWGTTENGTASRVLLKSIVPHQTIDYCQNIFRNYRILNSHICAGGKDRVDTCKGDSGGPLFFISPYKNVPRMVQYGVVSVGVASCGSEKSYPTIYTKVETYLPWITQNIA